MSTKKPETPKQPTAFPRPPFRPPPPPVPRYPVPPKEHSQGDQGVLIFPHQLKWSNEDSGVPPFPDASFENNGSFDIDFSALKQGPTLPSLMMDGKIANCTQATSVGGFFTVSNISQGYEQSPVQFQDKFSVRGFIHPDNPRDKQGDGGVLLTAWRFSGGLLLLMQWDDPGWLGPDWDYDDNQTYLWLPVGPAQPFTVIPDGRHLVLYVVPDAKHHTT